MHSDKSFNENFEIRISNSQARVASFIIGRPTKLARSGTPRTHATAYLLYNYPKVGNFIRDFQSNINTYIQNFDQN